MSIGNQKFGTPRKYKNQIDIWYFCPKYLGIFLLFYRIFGNDLVEIWLILVFLGRIEVGLVFAFCGCHFIGIDLVSVCIFLKMISLDGTGAGFARPTVPHLSRTCLQSRAPT